MLSKRRILALLSIAILVIASGAWIALLKLESAVRSEAGASLTAILSTTRQAARSWFNENRSDALFWADTEAIRDLAASLIGTPYSPAALLSSPAQTELRAWFRPIAKIKDYQGFFIVGPGNINLASSRDQNLGQINLLSRQSGLLDKIWAGETVLSMPQFSDVPLDNGAGELVEGLPTMFAGAPIRGADGNVTSVLLFRIDPHTDFTALFQSAFMGKTGETYAFDKKGRLISESRFDAHLRQVGLIPVGESGLLNIEVRNPKANLVLGERPTVARDQQPLTLMAQSAVAGDAGINLDGYRDYRGVHVIGTWLWDNHLGIGIATEIDLEEVKQIGSATRISFMLFAALSILTLIALATVFERSRAQVFQAQREAQQANRSKSEFLAMMSHELRTPMNAILGFSSMMKEKIFGPLNHERYEGYVEDINGAAQHLLDLINDILDLSQIEAGALDLEERPVDIADTAQQVLRLIGSRAEMAQVKIINEVGSGLRLLKCDERRLKQILINLLSNAVKFTEAKGQIVLDAYFDATNALTMTVTDNGIGMDEDELKVALSQFGQVTNSSYQSQEGTGLGLPVVQSLVELHGGKMTIESQKGQGTRVSIKFPPERTVQEG